MSISLGNLNITGISLGTTTFAEAYLGTVKIFDRSVSVPSNLIFRSDPASINENSLVLLPDNILLSWSATDATTERVYNKDTGALLGSRSPVSVTRPQRDTTYSFIASNVSGERNIDITVPVNLVPIISNLRVDYIQIPFQIGGVTARFRGQWVGKPKPTFSGNQGIGTIRERHINDDGTFEFEHYFGTMGNRTVTITATNRNGSDDESVVVTVP